MLSLSLSSSSSSSLSSLLSLSSCTGCAYFVPCHAEYVVRFHFDTEKYEKLGVGELPKGGDKWQGLIFSLIVVVVVVVVFVCLFVLRLLWLFYYFVFYILHWSQQQQYLSLAVRWSVGSWWLNMVFTWELWVLFEDRY